MKIYNRLTDDVCWICQNTLTGLSEITYIQGVSGGIVNILGGGSMDNSQ